MWSVFLKPAFYNLPTPYNKAHHRFCLFLAASTFLLIIAGALVTSNDAGLAVPDWPTSFGSLYKIPPMVGGVKYEHSHRMIAQFIGLLTIILAIWTQKSDQRTWIRKTAWAMLALVIMQGILGGLTVKMLLPWYISTAHAIFAQTFFSLTMLMVVFTGKNWVQGEAAQVAVSEGVDLSKLAWFGVAAVYMQTFLGAAFRHGGMHFLPHILGAGVATIILLALVVRVLTAYPQVRPLKGMAMAIMSLLILQLVLGFGAYLTRVEWGKNAVQPTAAMVHTTVAHVAVGALLLAHCFMLVAQAYRHAPPGNSAETAKP